MREVFPNSRYHGHQLARADVLRVKGSTGPHLPQLPERTLRERLSMSPPNAMAICVNNLPQSFEYSPVHAGYGYGHGHCPVFFGCGNGMGAGKPVDKISRHGPVRFSNLVRTTGVPYVGRS